MIKQFKWRLSKAKQGLKPIVLYLSQIKVCTLILSLQLVANEAYENDIKGMQASLRRKIRWISLIMEFKLDAC